jgi:O-antigen/teichoic acid export membrane protein
MSAPATPLPRVGLWPAARHHAGKPALLVFSANMLRAGCAFLLGLLVARVLGPAEFGLFTSFTVVTIWAHNLIGEGFDPGVVRLYARCLHDGGSGSAQRAAAVLGSALLMRALLALPVLLLFGVVAAWWLPPLSAQVARAGALTAVVASLATLSLAVLQARERFVAYALLMPLGNLLRLLALPLLWLAGGFTLWPLVATQALCFAVSAAIGAQLLRADLWPLRTDRATLRALFGFGKWSALATLCFLLQAYLAVPVLAHSHGAATAGVYAAAATLLLVVDQFTVALLTVKLPATSRISSLAGLRGFVRALAPRLLLLGLGLCLLVPLADAIVARVYGPAYGASAAVMRALLPGFVATLLSHPLYLVLYALDRPHAYAASGVAALAAWCALAAWLVPGHAELGAAWATTGSRVLQALLIVGMVAWAIRRRPGHAMPAASPLPNPSTPPNREAP